jgi:hypothetical protein
VAGRNSRWQKIPVLVYIGVALGASVGACVGDVLCLGYNIWYGPFLPQANVDPTPAGWVGWWVAGGAAAGAAGGLVSSVLLVGMWRRVRGSSGTVAEDSGDLEPGPAKGGPPWTSGMAIASLVLGICSFLCLGFLTGIPAIILGALGLVKIEQSRGDLKGKGMAIAGIVMGGIGTVFSALTVQHWIG